MQCLAEEYFLEVGEEEEVGDVEDLVEEDTMGLVQAEVVITPVEIIVIIVMVVEVVAVINLQDRHMALGMGIDKLY